MHYIKISISTLLTLLFIQCGNAPENTTTTPAEHKTEEAKAGSDQIHLSAAQKDQAGIETGTFANRPLSGYLPATAELTVGKEHTATVSAFAEGLLTDLRVSMNQVVQRGAIVAVMRKPDLVDMQQTFLENRDRMAFLQSEYDRYKSLKESDATASKNFVKADAELRAAQTTNKVMGAKLRQYQIDPERLTPDQIKTELVITAPISGTVSKVLVNTGTALTMGTAICEIADYTKLHPVLYVFEKDLFQVRNDQQVLLNFPSDPSRSYPATVYNIERSVDPERKAVRVHTRLATPAAANFAAGAYMDAHILLEKGTGVPALPSGAVIREGDTEYIFILEKDNTEGATFRKVAVKTGTSNDGFTAVTPISAIAPDAKIVLKGAYYVSAQGAGVSAEE